MSETKVSKEREQIIDRLLQELQRREERLLEVREGLSRHDLELGWERDQVNYCMGKADEVREILMILGFFNLKTAATERMKKAMGFR